MSGLQGAAAGGAQLERSHSGLLYLTLRVHVPKSCILRPYSTFSGLL